MKKLFKTGFFVTYLVICKIENIRSKFNNNDCLVQCLFNFILFDRDLYVIFFEGVWLNLILNMGRNYFDTLTFSDGLLRTNLKYSLRFVLRVSAKF